MTLTLLDLMQPLRRTQRYTVDLIAEHLLKDFAGIAIIQGVGSRILKQQGWRKGQAVGKRGAGIAEPLEADGLEPKDRRGFGYYGEPAPRDKDDVYGDERSTLKRGKLLPGVTRARVTTTTTTTSSSSSSAPRKSRHLIGSVFD